MAKKRDKTVWVDSIGPTGFTKPETRIEVIANMLDAIRRDTFVTRDAFLDRRLAEDVTGAPEIWRGIENDEMIGFHAGSYGPNIESWTPESGKPRSEPFNCYIKISPITKKPTVEYAIKVGSTYDDLEFDLVKKLLPEPWEVQDPLTVSRSTPWLGEGESIVHTPVTGKHGNDTTFHYLTTRGGSIVRCRLEWGAEGTLWWLFARREIG
jgi:hypothetical protein